MVQLDSQEETVMLALHDTLVREDEEGILNPTFFTIRESTERVENFTDEELTEVLRQLHEKGCVKASEAFRPRTHPDPQVVITPKGWKALDELGGEIPGEWLQAQKEILALLYQQEVENWDEMMSKIHLTRNELEREVDVPGGIFDLILSYLAENDWIVSDDKGYYISELGARAHETEKYTGKIRGFQ
jgi:DNA-binding PadR family transcriptional regulator